MERKVQVPLKDFRWYPVLYCLYRYFDRSLSLARAHSSLRLPSDPSHRRYTHSYTDVSGISVQPSRILTHVVHNVNEATS